MCLDLPFRSTRSIVFWLVLAKYTFKRTKQMQRNTCIKLNKKAVKHRVHWVNGPKTTSEGRKKKQDIKLQDLSTRCHCMSAPKLDSSHENLHQYSVSSPTKTKWQQKIFSHVVLDGVIIQSYNCSSGLLHQGLIPSAIRVNSSHIYQICKKQIGWWSCRKKKNVANVVVSNSLFLGA